MAMIDNLKILLNTSNEALLNILIPQAETEVINYCHLDSYPSELMPIIEEIVMIKWNRLNSHGLSNQSANGVSESYIDGYPKHIIQSMNRYRKLKVI